MDHRILQLFDHDKKSKSFADPWIFVAHENIKTVNDLVEYALKFEERGKANECE